MRVLLRAQGRKLGALNVAPFSHAKGVAMRYYTMHGPVPTAYSPCRLCHDLHAPNNSTGIATAWTLALPSSMACPLDADITACRRYPAARAGRFTTSENSRFPARTVRALSIMFRLSAAGRTAGRRRDVDFAVCYLSAPRAVLRLRQVGALQTQSSADRPSLPRPSKPRC